MRPSSHYSTYSPLPSSNPGRSPLVPSSSSAYSSSSSATFLSNPGSSALYRDQNTYSNPNPSSSSLYSSPSMTSAPSSRFSSVFAPATPASPTLFEPPRKLSSFQDFSCSASSFDTRLPSRKVSDTRPPARPTRTAETDNLLELYGVRKNSGAAAETPAKRKSSFLEERKRTLASLDEGGGPLARRGSAEYEGFPGTNRDLLGAPAQRGAGGLVNGAEEAMNQIEYTNRLLEAHKRVDDLLRRRGLSSEDERKYLRAWEEIPVIREVRNEALRGLRRRSNSSDSGLSTDSDEKAAARERTPPPPVEEITADEDWEVDEFEEEEAETVIPISPTESVEKRCCFMEEALDCPPSTIRAPPVKESARRCIVQRSKIKEEVSASFRVPTPKVEKAVAVSVDMVIAKPATKETTRKQLSVKTKKEEKVMGCFPEIRPLPPPPPTPTKNGPDAVAASSCEDKPKVVFRARPRSQIQAVAKAPPSPNEDENLLKKAVLRNARKSMVDRTSPPAEESEKPLLRRATVALKPDEVKPKIKHRLTLPIEQCKTILASLRPKNKRLSRSSAEISVQHCSFFSTAKTFKVPEKNVRINLRLTERAPYKEKTKIILACARHCQVRLDVYVGPRFPERRRRTLQLPTPKRQVGKLERAMTIEVPVSKPGRVVKPLQIPTNFLEPEAPPPREDYKSARQNLRKVADCLSGIGISMHWVDPKMKKRQAKKRREEPKKEEGSIVERLIGKEEAEQLKDGKKLKRQNAIKRRKDVTSSMTSLESDASKASVPSLNSNGSLARPATASGPRAEEKKVDEAKTKKIKKKPPPISTAPIAHTLNDIDNIPETLVQPATPSPYRPPSPLILDEIDRILVEAFRRSLQIPIPQALRPRAASPFDKPIRVIQEIRLRGERSPSPAPIFLCRRTPDRRSRSPDPPCNPIDLRRTYTRRRRIARGDAPEEYGMKLRRHCERRQPVMTKRKKKVSKAFVPQWRKGSEYEEEEEVVEEEVEEIEEEVAEEEEEATRPAYESNANLTEAEKAMIAAKKRHEDDEQAKLEDYETKRRAEREKEEEELRKLKERQEARKKEREEEERAMAERKRIEEERRKQEEEERRARVEAEKKKKDEEKNKRQAMVTALPGGKNFVIPEKKTQGDKFGNIVQAKQEMGMTKDQQLEAKRVFMQAISKGIDASGLLPADLKIKIKELHARLCKLEAEKYDLQRRHERQEYDLKELNERQRQMARNSALKKGLDPNDASSRHPPRVRVASKYERSRAFTASFADRKTMFQKPKVQVASKYDRTLDRRNFNERRMMFENNRRAFPLFPGISCPPTPLERLIKAERGADDEDDYAAYEREEEVELGKSEGGEESLMRGSGRPPAEWIKKPVEDSDLPRTGRNPVLRFIEQMNASGIELEGVEGEIYSTKD